MKLRVAMRGWNCDRGATTAEEVAIGIGVPWVEFLVDGQPPMRIREVTDLQLAAAQKALLNPHSDEQRFTAEGFSVVTLGLLAAVEIVYVDGDGEQLPGIAMQPKLPEHIDSRTAVLAQDPRR